MEDNDLQQQLKKRARRRLVGAVFFVSLVAVFLPTLMDSEPRPPVQDIDIRIPGQDEKSFAPALIPPAEPLPASKAAEKMAAAPEPEPALLPPVNRDKKAEPKLAPRVETKPEAKPEPRAEVKADKKPLPAPPKEIKESTKEASKAAALDKPAASAADEASRAAAILSGKPADTPAAAAGGAHVILIGAFSNEANVNTLRKKLAEQGIKVYTEALDSPQGKKTRVRAGPFPSRDAAEKALQKMQKIGVSGVVAAKP